MSDQKTEQKPEWAIWGKTSDRCRHWMRDIGFFSPTVREAAKELKGCTPDGKGGSVSTYLESKDLRELACACIEAADWLDARAMLAARTQESRHD